jgi:hypothetical protein
MVAASGNGQNLYSRSGLLQPLRQESGKGIEARFVAAGRLLCHQLLDHPQHFILARFEIC